VFSSSGCVVTNVSYYNGARGSGDGRVQVTHNKTEDYAPSYSPDGKKIAYSRNDGNELEIYTIKATGGKPFQVTNNNKDDNFPSYSPDGKKIAYTGCKGNDHGGDIYTINVGGGGKFRVTHNNADEAAPSWGVVRSGFSSGRRGRPRVEV
jgi:Tol biopolymer transport system component